MKKHILFFVIIILLVISNSSKAQNLVVKNESKSSLSLELTIDNYNIKEINDGKEILHEVVLSSITIPNDKGKPNLPSVNRFIAIPNNAKAKVVVNNYKKEILKDINIAPSRGIVSEYDTTNSDYIKDSDIYSKDELFPANIVSITEDINLRGVEAIGLNISPIQYNPVKKELIVYTEIELSIEYEGGDSKFGDDRLRSMHWDPILQHNILNYNSLPEINYSERFQQWIADNAEGAEYLIIIPDDESIREQAQRLADYRNKQGIITKVYSLDEMNAHSHEEIRDWFVDAYNNWDIAPVAVCILGDYNIYAKDGIPAFIFDFNEYGEKYISDRPFSDIDDDFIPEIAFSRLSADNAEEARIMVDKQINYEFLNPVMDEEFYDRPLLTSAYQQSKWFQISAACLKGHLQTLGKDPNTISMIYNYEGNYNEDIWSSADNSDQVVNYFGPNGLGYIPATPGEMGGFIEYENSETLPSTISQNPGYIVLNRDHGWYSLWSCPNLRSSGVRTMTNYDKLPFVLSINCASGAFNQDDCLTEAFMKLENAGSVGVIAPTFETHSYTNDSFLWGVWDFFENDFLPDYGTSVENNNNYMPAFANTSAKHFLYQQNFPNTYQNTRELASNLFHAHCDAFLKLYSEVPQEMTIEHDDFYYYESNTFNIKAPIGSMIGISTEKSGRIKVLAIAEGTGDMQAIFIPNNTTPGSKLYVTVTNTNHLRYEKEINISTNEAFIIMEDFNLYDDSHEIILNQDTYLDIIMRNIGDQNISSINLSLRCNSDIITITENNNTIEEIISYDTIYLEDAFYLDITDGIPNGSLITFTMTIEFDDSTYEQNFDILVNSYNFEIINTDIEETEGNSNNIIEPGEFAKFIFTIKNTGNFTMDNIYANLISNDNYVRVITEDLEVSSLDINESIDIEFETYIEWDVTEEPISLTLELNIDDCRIMENIEYYIGILFEDFENETFNSNLWQNDINSPWYIDSSEAYEGKHSLRSGDIDDDESTSISINIENFIDQNLKFYYKVSSEEYWDYFIFYIDGTPFIQEHGVTNWKYAEYYITKGNHTFKWEYTKDPMSSDGSDCVWIDFITLPYSACTGIDEKNIDDISIYPNPADETINIDIKDNNIKPKDIIIYNNNGVKVIEQEFSDEIDISKLDPGLYMIKIRYNDNNYVRHILVE